VVEFKKGVAGIEDDLEEAVNEAEAKAKKSKHSAEEADA
jgi:Sec-independent protein translocase protein TatA